MFKIFESNRECRKDSCNAVLSISMVCGNDGVYIARSREIKSNLIKIYALSAHAWLLHLCRIALFEIKVKFGNVRE